MGEEEGRGNVKEEGSEEVKKKNAKMASLSGL